MEQNHFECDEDQDNDNDDDSWDEMDDNGQAEPTKCLFCDNVECSIEKAIEHLNQHHRLSLNAVKEKFNLDQYNYIKVSSIQYAMPAEITE